MKVPKRLKLPGCSPTPLASYLKALGVLRLLSSGTNSETGNPADPEVRGWWEDMQFHLDTKLESDDLIDFFLYRYVPTPIIAPWNGGSGFYPKDKKDGIEPLESDVVAPRFRPFSNAVGIASKTLQEFGLDSKPKGDTKARLIEALRARLPDAALGWLDASIVLSGKGLRFPPLLGTGGNDGRLEFTNNLMQRLFSRATPQGIFDAASGTPLHSSENLLVNALFSTPIHDLANAKIGQFSPGGAGGLNASTGHKGDSVANSWDYVFMLEGASTFASVATRRHESNDLKQASFPFTVAASGTGWGGIEDIDEEDARAEFWAPIWTRPARFCEINALFGEGRAVMHGRTVRDGFGFARAISQLGVSRGFSEFQRFGFFRRAGKNHYAVAIGRRRAEPSLVGANLVANLDRCGWLEKVRRFGRATNQATSIRRAVSDLEESLFDLLAPGMPTPRTVCAALTAVGHMGLRLSTCEPDKSNKSRLPPPPPLLPREWMEKADDQSPEFRIAASLASLGIPDTRAGTNSALACVPPMAAHLVRLTRAPSAGYEARTYFQGHCREWERDSNPPTVVWGHGGLIANLTAILERRLIEVSIRGLEDNPLGGAAFAQLGDIAAFLGKEFDDTRCSGLLSGMVWAQPAKLAAIKYTSSSSLPFAYAALKPIFATNRVLRKLGAISPERSVPIPSGVVSRLRGSGSTGDGRAINNAVQVAFARARSSGLFSPFDQIMSGGRTLALNGGRIGVGIRPDRLAAALLIPISNLGLASLLNRAYPGAIQEPIFSKQIETRNVD